jgi:hypothetical protein
MITRIPAIRPLVAFGILAALAIAATQTKVEAAPNAGALSVNVTNTPLTVQPKAPEIVQKHFFLCSPNCIIEDAYVVPAGKRLVIEYVNFAAISTRPDAIDYVLLKVKSGDDQAGVILPLESRSRGEGAIWSSAHMTKLYADANTNVEVFVERLTLGVEAATMTISGYLIDMP